MGDALPPDPYLALGVAKDATAAAIKTQYRKLVLKFHPDKVQDESQKQAAANQFHKIQTAYEIVSDEARRARYDAQCKLAELRKDVMDRERGGRRHSSDDDRSPRYASQPEPMREHSARERGARPSAQYSTEERRPTYAPQQDYFDPAPRATARKDTDYERTSRRTSPREEKVKSSKASSVGGKKKDERSSRKEKSRKSDRDVRQDRQRKFATATVEEESSSDSDPYERRRREMQEEDESRRRFHEQERRQREEADQGYFGDAAARAQKLFSQTTEARDYIGRSVRTPRTEEPERYPSSSRDRVEPAPARPTAARVSSMREGMEQTKKSSDRPAYMYRTGSGQIRTKDRSSDRRAREPEVVEEPAREAKRPPTLSHAKSSPPVVQSESHPQPDKQRSYSVQHEPEEPPIPKMRRAETMPYPKHKESAPEKGSRLRHSALPTPDTSPERPSRRSNYGQSQAYADDVEYASPDGYEVPASSRYQTEERKPQRATSAKRDRYAEEPTVAIDSRERQRSTSTKHAAQPHPSMPRTSSTQYVYQDGQTYARPTSSRENSARLYGEIPTTSRSPGVSRPSRYSPPAQETYYTRNFAQEPLNMQSGFKTKERPEMHRRGTSSRQMVQ